MKYVEEGKGTFPCPVCGNPLIRSRRCKKVTCVYCRQIVEAPEFKGKKRGNENDNQKSGQNNNR